MFHFPGRFIEEKQGLAGQYKIHLMPTDDTIDNVFERLLVLVRESKDFQSVLNQFKIVPSYRKTQQQAEKGNEDADFKIAPWGSKYYEQPHMVYYNKDEIAHADGTDHYLRFPGIDKPITDIE